MIVIERGKKFQESPRLFLKQENKRDINFLVLHHVEATSADHAIEQFVQYEVSSHFLIDEEGKIFELVDENDVAYHAGVSFCRGVDGLNKSSIGIEFINSAPFEKNFPKAQMQAGIELCQYLISKYNIDQRNIVGHSDIAYSRDTGLLDRKQDPSHLFDWKLLAQNGVGIFPEKIALRDKPFEFGDEHAEIKKIKSVLRKIGYRILNFDEKFDEEMRALSIVLNRKFINKELDKWIIKIDSLDINSLLS